MSEQKRPTPTTDADPSDEPTEKTDGRSSLDRLVAFTRRILRVNKVALPHARESRSDLLQNE